MTHHTALVRTLATVVDHEYYEAVTGEQFGSVADAASHYATEGFTRDLPFNPLIDIQRAAPPLNKLWHAGDLEGFLARLTRGDLAERTGWMFDPGTTGADLLLRVDQRIPRGPDEGWLPFFMRSAAGRTLLPVSSKYPMPPPVWANVRRAAIAAGIAWRQGSGVVAPPMALATPRIVGIVLTCRGPLADVLAAARRLGGLGSDGPMVAIVVTDGSVHTATALAAAAAEQDHIVILPQSRRLRAIDALTIGAHSLEAPVVMHVSHTVRLDGASAIKVADRLLETSAVVAQPLLLDESGLIWHGGTVYAAGTPLAFLAGHPPDDAAKHGGEGFRSVSSSAFAVRCDDFVRAVGTPGYVAEALHQVERRLGVHDEARGLVVTDARATVDTRRSTLPVLHAGAASADDVAEHYERAGFACDVTGGVVGRRLVADRRCEPLANDSSVLAAGVFPRLRWALKIAAPAGLAGDTWGDTYFADELACALRRLGQDVVVDRREAHARATSVFDDVVVWLRGLVPMERQPGACNVLWVISHPDTVTDDEISAADLVFAASDQWAESTQKRLGRRVSTLLQACDPSQFYPLLHGPRQSDKAFFLGSPRARGGRPVVNAALKAGIPLEVVGPRWRELLPPGVYGGPEMGRALVNHAYQRSLLVLCDHWPDMAKEGFISNRVFDAVASGARVVSDDVVGMQRVFGDAVVIYKTPEDLARIASAPDDYFVPAAQRSATARVVARAHSFGARAREMLTSVLDSLKGEQGGARMGNPMEGVMQSAEPTSVRFASDRLVRRYAASQAGLPLEEYEDAIARLAFRCGFILVPDSSHAVSHAKREGWISSRMGGYWFVSHPDARVVTSAGSVGTLILIGEAFDPWTPSMSPAEIADSMRRELEATRDIYSLLDRLAGRFRVLWIQPGGATVWHDAMGSGSVFYDEDGGGCASHAALLAECLMRPQRDYVIPFLNSEGYRRRDVKYFPGLLAPYEGIVQLSPNTELSVHKGAVRRYWPREDVVRVDPSRAFEILTEYLLGQAAWMRAMGRAPLLGVTSGTDSRGLLAASAGDHPRLFTYVRSATGNDRANEDSRAAESLAGRVGLRVHVLQVQDSIPLSGSGRPIDVAYRLASGGIRGANATWVSRLAQQLEVGAEDLMVRGFGGEVLRGFYQSMATAMKRLSPNQLARTYDVNAGAGITRAAFAHMLEVAQMARAVEAGMDPNDVLYWEHRMGTWGSISMLESDLAANGMPGYNARMLFEAFLGLSERGDVARRVMHDAITAIKPVLMR